MIIINKLQKAVYDCLKSQNSQNFQKLTGIFNYIEKNSSFPYIFITTKDFKDISTYSKKIYTCSLIINIYEENTTNGFVINLANEIKEIFSNILYFSMDEYELIDLEYLNFNILLENNNKIWNGELIYNTIIRKK